jgi:hypothetical protein
VTDDALALAFRTGLPFVGLRDHEHDPDLDRLIPPDAARAARAVPLAADDDHLRLAVTDPEADLAPLSPYLGDLRVELALAAEEEIEAILGPPPPEPLATEPEPLAVEPFPDPLAAEPEATEHKPPESLAADPTPLEPIAAEPEATEPEPLAAEPAPPEPLAAEHPPPEPLAAEHPAPEPAAPEPQATASVAADPELDGEVPSWLEAPRRRGKVAVAAFIVAMLLIVAAGAVAAYVLTR